MDKGLAPGEPTIAADYFTHGSSDSRGADLWENLAPVERVGYLTDLLSEKAAQFVGRRRSKPFYRLHYLPIHRARHGAAYPRSCRIAVSRANGVVINAAILQACRCSWSLVFSGDSPREECIKGRRTGGDEVTGRESPYGSLPRLHPIRHWVSMCLRLILALILITTSIVEARQAADQPPRIVKLPLKGLLGVNTTLEVRLPAEQKESYPVVLLVHGWAGWARLHESIAQHLVERGFAVAMFDNPSRLSFDLNEWRKRTSDAIDAIEKTNTSAGSALEKKLDLKRFGMLGHSYGGSTTMALAGSDPRVKVAVALAPGTALLTKSQFDRQTRNVKTPLLVIGAEYDGLCPAKDFARPALEASPSNEKLYVEIARAGHFDFADIDFRTLGDVSQTLLRFFSAKSVLKKDMVTISGEKQRQIASEYFTPWLEHYLNVRQDTEGFTTGVMADKLKAEGVLSLVLKPRLKPN